MSVYWDPVACCYQNLNSVSLLFVYTQNNNKYNYIIIILPIIKVLENLVFIHATTKKIILNIIFKRCNKMSENNTLVMVFCAKSILYFYCILIYICMLK